MVFYLAIEFQSFRFLFGKISMKKSSTKLINEAYEQVRNNDDVLHAQLSYLLYRITIVYYKAVNVNELMINDQFELSNI